MINLTKIGFIIHAFDRKTLQRIFWMSFKEKVVKKYYTQPFKGYRSFYPTAHSYSLSSNRSWKTTHRNPMIDPITIDKSSSEIVQKLSSVLLLYQMIKILWVLETTTYQIFFRGSQSNFQCDSMSYIFRKYVIIKLP